MSGPEVWLQGPVPGIAGPLQPVAHALLQAADDMDHVVNETPDGQLWSRPGGAASIGYHARHAAGALDRLFTYARGESLSDGQRSALAAEGAALEREELQRLFHDSIERALAQLRGTDAAVLAEPRAVGRAGLPSTVLGLLFHGAEHTARHTGQAITTARILAGLEPR